MNRYTNQTICFYRCTYSNKELRPHWTTGSYETYIVNGKKMCKSCFKRNHGEFIIKKRNGVK